MELVARLVVKDGQYFTLPKPDPEEKFKLLCLNDISAEIETIEGRIETTIETIRNNSARVGEDETAFGNIDEHKKKLDALIQSIDDLTKRRETLRMVRSYANASVSVTLPDSSVVRTHAALDMERRSIKWRHAARTALDTGWRNANSDRSMRANPQPVIRLFDEAKRLKQQDQLAELGAKIKPAIRQGNHAKFVELNDDKTFTLHLYALEASY
jgi:hypothetical protein